MLITHPTKTDPVSHPESTPKSEPENAPETKPDNTPKSELENAPEALQLSNTSASLKDYLG